MCFIFHVFHGFGCGTFQLSLPDRGQFGIDFLGHHGVVESFVQPLGSHEVRRCFGSSVKTFCDRRVSARSESISTELAATLSHVFPKRIYFNLHLQVICFSLSRFLTWVKTVDSLIYKWFKVYDIDSTIKNCWLWWIWCDDILMSIQGHQ